MRLAKLCFAVLMFGCAIARANPDLLVSSRLGNKVLHYDGSGAFVGQFDNGGDLHTPNGIAMGADGKIYLSSRDGAQVLRYFSDGTFDKGFASGPEMIGPSGLVFGPSGDLYVANSLNQNVGRYDRISGALVQVIGSSAELNAPIGVAFGNDGDLYVTSAVNNRLVKYDGTSGALDGVLFQNGLLGGPADIKLAPDGNLYIASSTQNRIAKYDPVGNSLTSFLQSATLQSPVGLGFSEGDLFVCSFNGDKIVRVNMSGASISGNYVAPGSGGLDGPQFMAFVPEPVSSIVLLIFMTAAGSRSVFRRRDR